MTGKRIGEKTWGLFWLFVYFCSLIPVFVLGCYNFPSADDYGYSIYTRLAWVDTHSLLQVIAAACRKTAEVWETWQGTYASVFLMALQPGIFGDSFYALTPWIILVPYSLASLYLFRTVFERLLGASRWISLSATCIYLLVGVQTMVDKTQGLFWYNGAVHYMLPQAALLALTGLVLRMAAEPENRTKLRMVAAALLIAYIGGGNLVTGLECGIWLAIAFLLALVKKKRTLAGKYAGLLGVWLIAFGINVIAPGNFLRQEDFSYRPGVVRSVLQSFYYCLDYVFGDWGDWTVFALIVLVFPFVAKAVHSYCGRFSFPCPLLVPALSFCILSSMFTPSVYATGEPGSGRIYNIIYLIFLLLVVVNMLYLYGWFVKKSAIRVAIGEKDDLLFRVFGLLGIAFCAVLVAAAVPERYTSVASLECIVSGEAKVWKAEEEARMEILLDDSVQDAQLEEFSVKPALLYNEDIEAEADNWKNVRMSSYFRKNSVRLIQSAE